MARILVFALLFTVCAPLLGQSSDPVHDLKELEQQWARAIEHHDTVALEAILAPDFRDIAYDGAVRSRAQAIAAAADRRRRVSISLRDLEVRTYGGQVAVVNGVNDARTPQGAATVRFTDVFARRQGRWQAVSAQETLVQQPATDN